MLIAACMQDVGDASLPAEVSQESSQVKKAKADELDKLLKKEI
jgi:hypothetical protein